MPLVTTTAVQQSYTAAAAIAGGSGLQVDDLSTLAAVTESHALVLVPAITAPTAAVLHRMTFPYAVSITGAVFSVATAAGTGTPTFDIKQGATSIYTTLPTINATGTASNAATIPGTLTNTTGAGVAVAANVEISVSCTVVGTSTLGVGVILFLRRTS